MKSVFHVRPAGALWHEPTEMWVTWCLGQYWLATQLEWLFEHWMYIWWFGDYSATCTPLQTFARAALRPAASCTHPQCRCEVCVVSKVRESEFNAKWLTQQCHVQRKILSRTMRSIALCLLTCFPPTRSGHMCVTLTVVLADEFQGESLGGTQTRYDVFLSISRVYIHVV